MSDVTAPIPNLTSPSLRVESPIIPVPQPEPLSPADEATDIFASFFSGFGFRPNLGRIWGILFFAQRPMTQREIAEGLQLSIGLVSRGLSELHQFCMVHTLEQTRGREALYVHEHNLLQIVASILRRREKQIIVQLEDKVHILQSQLAVLPSSEQVHQKRLEGLEQILVICQLATSIIQLVEMFSKYSHHAVSLGAKALRKLQVSQLPQLLGLTQKHFSTKVKE
ncbi:MAG: hypothetical protein AAGJ35_02550 [Myxococcota bacterium]